MEKGKKTNQSVESVECRKAINKTQTQTFIKDVILKLWISFDNSN